MALPQAQPIRRARWWGFCVVWALWQELWDQWCHLPVRKTDGIDRKCSLQCTCSIVTVVFFLHSLLDSWSSDLFSHHISLFRYTSGSPENSREAKGGVRDTKTWKRHFDVLLFQWMLNDVYICWESKHYYFDTNKSVYWCIHLRHSPRIIIWNKIMQEDDAHAKTDER